MQFAAIQASLSGTLELFTPDYLLNRNVEEIIANKLCFQWRFHSVVWIKQFESKLHHSIYFHKHESIYLYKKS
jgi:hypothetical protein